MLKIAKGRSCPDLVLVMSSCATIADNTQHIAYDRYFFMLFDTKMPVTVKRGEMTCPICFDMSYSCPLNLCKEMLHKSWNLSTEGHRDEQ